MCSCITWLNLTETTSRSSYQDGVAETLVLHYCTGLWRALGRSLLWVSSASRSSCPWERWSLGNSGGLYLWKNAGEEATSSQNQTKLPPKSLNESAADQQWYLMVIIFLCMTAESSFFMRLMFPAHWNFSELMKKIGCFTRGKISSSKGVIQESNATPHLFVG